MTARPIPTNAIRLYHEAVAPTTDETHPRYEVEVEAICTKAGGELVEVRSRIAVGHGIGPHWGRSARRLRAFGWALIHAADRIDEQHGHTPAQDERLPFPMTRRARR